MIKTSFLAALAVTLLASGGCTIYVGGHEKAWYDVYGRHCGDGNPRSGCNFYYDGDKIRANEDPNAASRHLSYGHYEYYDSYGYYRTFLGWAWASPSGILYDEYGNALNENDDQDTRDLISDVASQEQETIQAVGREFASRHALSEDAGMHIARTLSDWATLVRKQNRARTVEDVADFSKRLYGVSPDKAEAALAAAHAGDQKAVQAINSDIAGFWGTTPETTAKILKGWYESQLSEAGVN